MYDQVFVAIFSVPGSVPDVYVNCRGETFLKPLTFFELVFFIFH
jgi:hypothetical protein